MATLAARIVGLDVAGVDLVAEDITRPLEPQRGAIVEVNAGPGLLMHLKPAQGEPRPVGRAIVDHLIPQSENGRIPIIGISGNNGTLVAQLVASLLHLSGRYVGLACSDGLYMNQRQVERGNCTTWQAGQRLLMNRAVEAAVFEHPATAILREGLAYDRCQVGVVTEVSGADTLGEFYISEPDQLYNVLRTQMDVVLSDGVAVLNADDALVVKMASLCDGAIIFFGLAPQSPIIIEHRAKGGRTLFVRDGKIILASGAKEVVFVQLSALPLTRLGQPRHHTASLLAAIGVAWALDIAPELIHAGIETYELGQPAHPLFGHTTQNH